MNKIHQSTPSNHNVRYHYYYYTTANCVIQYNTYANWNRVSLWTEEALKTLLLYVLDGKSGLLHRYLQYCAMQYCNTIWNSLCGLRKPEWFFFCAFLMTSGLLLCYLKYVALIQPYWLSWSKTSSYLLTYLQYCTIRSAILNSFCGLRKPEWLFICVFLMTNGLLQCRLQYCTVRNAVLNSFCGLRSK